ncbi:hypothetical protein G7Y41_03030 [Schaalia sp. ZJ405]|uniref:hypothetical protein n=1 Tax=Schaalia sp. ZJ405 TaxID=2709403 RepID=UPI0013EC95A1|nr:hypothetical protein [Schaalia sp. ZJ405]QPK81813.1 hypothetical protein G7Y41_03030 [Schaalia sp. ZJ405]
MKKLPESSSSLKIPGSSSNDYSDVPMKHDNNALRSALVVFSSVGLIAGCTSPDHHADAIPEKVDTASAYSAEFAQIQKTAHSDLGKSIVNDSQITEQEILELQSAFEDCMAQNGFPGTDVDSLDGALLIPDHGGPMENVDLTQKRCEAETDWGDIQFLFNKITDNPENIPIEELMARCLRRHGAVSEDYTSEDYLAAEAEYHAYIMLSDDEKKEAAKHLNFISDDGPQILMDCQRHMSE